jgi:hypothetical protein
MLLGSTRVSLVSASGKPATRFTLTAQAMISGLKAELARKARDDLPVRQRCSE